MTGVGESDLSEVFGSHNVFLERDLPEGALGSIFASFFARLPRKDFQRLHFAYAPVPEVYLLNKQFDTFCPPQSHLNRLGEEPPEDITVFLEALGCYFEPNEHQRISLNSILRTPIAEPSAQQRQGVVLMCWDRIEQAAGKQGVETLHLLSAVAFHEHSHAARAAQLLKHAATDLLRREETVAQQEAYIFLRSRSDHEAIDAMKRLMDEQPDCYQIPIP